MAKRDEQRRTKRLAKQKKRRANASRPSKDPGSMVAAPPPSTSGASQWPLGDCLVSERYDQPSAELTAVVTRVHPDGRAMAAFVELDRATEGIRSIKLQGFPSLDNVYGECANRSERSDQAIIGAPSGIVAGLIVDAYENGSNRRPAGWDKLEQLLHDIEPLEARPAFGEPPVDKPKGGGLLDRLFRWLG
ncbi:MAG: hypothetical protein AAGA48_26085 [Myxococcota bacterium]